MVKIVFFASIREVLGCASLDLNIGKGVSLSRLVAMLGEQRGELWCVALTAENVRVAVNQELVQGDPLLSIGDEIAFFPPVTGG